MTSTLQIRNLAVSVGIAAAFVGGLTGCSDTVGVVAGPTPVNSLFQSYVALGNSLTAGYQSGGINDSTQQESYAALLAGAMHTRYAYPALALPGCPPPIVDFTTQGRLGGQSSTSTTCALRNPASVTAALNNVAVPGATSLDPTSVSTVTSNALTTLVLGGKTHVQRAADAQPTFVSAWIGNNDVLAAAVTGLLVPTASPVPSIGVTPEDTFEKNYRAMLRGLTSIPTVRGGALIGVVQVTAAPVLFPAEALVNGSLLPTFELYAGPVTIGASCLPSTTSLISFEIVAAIRGGQHPPDIECTKQGNTSLGDVFVLDASEQAQLTAAVTGYNTFIKNMADSLGWAYYDPNTTLAALKAPPNSCINAIPDLTSATHPFGTCVSLDGIHPTAKAHEAIVNDLMDAINSKYGTTLQHVSVQ